MFKCVPIISEQKLLYEKYLYGESLRNGLLMNMITTSELQNGKYMITLTFDQKQFVDKHNISANQILDASNMKKNEYSKIMKDYGFVAAIGVTPCSKAGHQLRNSSGHCIQCNPAYLAYRKHFKDAGWIYLAESASSKIVKIGFTRNLKKREASLREQKYGGYSDWLIKYEFYKENGGGEIEKLLHKKLKAKAQYAYYKKENKDQMALEMFNCTIDEIKKILVEINYEIDGK